MFLTNGGKPAIDYDLNMLREIALVIAKRLDDLDREILKYPDPDQFGFYDTAEGLCGIGFVACQQYFVATASWLRCTKSMAFSHGPVHPCGERVVSIINHAANYWKHGHKWVLGNSEHQEFRTQDGLELILSDVEDGYFLTVILARLVTPLNSYRLGHLLPKLAAWRDELCTISLASEHSSA